MKKLPTWLSLFLSFLKIGAFTFGGGYAMLALLESEFVSRKKWLTKEEYLDVIAIAESTPGPIAVNTATYIGYKMVGVLGAFLATLAVCLPAFTIIFVISLFFDRFLSLRYVAYAFRGIQIAVVYLIGSAGCKVFKDIKKTPFSVLVTVTVFLMFIFFTIFSVTFSSIICILVCGVAGLAVTFLFKTRRRAKTPVGDLDLTAALPKEGSAPSEEAREEGKEESSESSDEQPSEGAEKEEQGGSEK